MSIPIVHTDKKYANLRRLTSTLSCVIYKANKTGVGPVIMKKFREDEYSRIYDHVIRETTILHNISHPNIVQLIEICPETSYPRLILEYCGISLWDYALSLSWKACADKFDEIFSQVLSAVFYLHSNGIIHRDIKATNVLIQGNTVKLCDFGLARRITGDDLGLIAYTINYRAPEVLAGNVNYGTSADMWAMGCMMYDFIAHTMLFGKGNEDENDDYILTEILEEVPVTSEELEIVNVEHNIPNGAKWKKVDRLTRFLNPIKIMMVKSLLSVDPRNRQSARECLQLLGFSPEPPQISPQPFLVRSKIKSDINIRYIMVSHILTIGDQYPVSPFTVATAVEIYDRFLINNREKEIDQNKMILYYIAAVIISSCVHETYKLDPSDFESVYDYNDIVNAMKSLFRDIRYNIDNMSLWQIVYAQIKMNMLGNTDEKKEQYWEIIKEIYLDYENMIGLSKRQMTRKIMKLIEKHEIQT